MHTREGLVSALHGKLGRQAAKVRIPPLVSII